MGDCEDVSTLGSRCLAIRRGLAGAGGYRPGDDPRCGDDEFKPWRCMLLRLRSLELADLLRESSAAGNGESNRLTFAMLDIEGKLLSLFSPSS